MIQQIKGLAGNVAAFNVTGEVTEQDYEQVILPTVENITSTYHHLNFLLILNTDLKNFTFGAWMQDALLTLKNLIKFKKVALVSDSEAVKKITTLGAHFIPGEYQTFPLMRQQAAINWVNSTEV